ncbi:hypothetical protein [Bacillus marasmi]|uniref:hypothetical protein n=1 Tax=Bacillus marasmi TaxID=1926279 RepID=UPI0011CB7EBA|nr:hypothetical protein [Bacillus marasmi]
MKQSKWLNQANGRLDRIIETMHNDGLRRLKVDKIKKIVGRIDEFSQENCEQCQALQQKADVLIGILEDMLRGKSINPQEYKDIYKELLTHVKKGHGLFEPGQLMNQWLVIGLLIGSAFMFLNLYSVSIGLISGIIIGAIFDANAKKKGRVI